VTLRTALEQGTAILAEASVGAPRLTAEVLLAHALRRDRVYLIAHADDELSELGWIHFGRYLHQRTAGVPTQYITKVQEFYGRPFHVTPDVLIPRPETEHVVATALELLSSSKPLRVVDVGTGSGAIAVSLALESRHRIAASDISGSALRVAAGNAKTLHACVSFLHGDLLLPFADASLDAVVSNPPYVGLNEADGLQHEVRDHEPHVALFAGDDGHAIYRRIVADARRVLRPGGLLVLELGYRSLEAVQSMLTPPWTDLQHEADLAGIPRVLAARWLP
jgi:release factor glutamine methyltransferase